MVAFDYDRKFGKAWDACGSYGARQPTGVGVQLPKVMDIRRRMPHCCHVRSNSYRLIGDVRDQPF